MTKPEDIPQWAWEKAAVSVGTTERPDLVQQWIARAILSAVEEERESILGLLAGEAPHSPRRYIYDIKPDRRIWACDKLEESIRSRKEA